jgi:hypothetical protein
MIILISHARPEHCREHIGDLDPAFAAELLRPIVLGARFLDISKTNPAISEVEINGLRNPEIFNAASICT